MRDLLIRQETLLALEEAQAAAIAAIGLRGDEAAAVMRAARSRVRKEARDERWSAIVRLCRNGRFPTVKPSDWSTWTGEPEPCDQGAIQGTGQEPMLDASTIPQAVEP